MTMVIREPDGLNIHSLDDVERLARTAVASGLVAVKRAEEAVVLLLTGRELGLSPMQSLRGIYVVGGKPVLSADLMVAVVRRSGLCRSWRVVKSTAAECTIETQREGETEVARKTWTADDAKRAGLLGKGTWAQYPAQMLRHRVAADLAREVYPDVILGLYTDDEIDRTAAPVVVRDEPEGSRAFAQFVASVEVADRVVVVHLAYRDLLAGLAEEGGDVVEYVDGKGGAYALAVEAIRRRVSISEAEVRAVLASEVPELARWLDAAADHAADLDTAARWWVRVGEIIHRDHRPIVRKALARTVAGIADDAVATGKAMRAMAAAVAALRPPEPPTGTDAPAAGEHVAAEGAAAQSAIADAPSAADWTRSRDGMRSHLASKTVVRAVLNSVVAHGSLRGYATLAAERIQALTGWDLDAAEAQISDAFARANERRERASETAAMVRRAA